MSQLGSISARVQLERKNHMGYWIYCRNFTLYQRSKRTCKKPESTYFLLCGPKGLCHSSPILLYSTEEPLTMQKQIGSVVFQQNLILKKKTDSGQWVIWSSLLYTRVGLAGDMTSQRGVWEAPSGKSLNSHHAALVQRTFRSWRWHMGNQASSTPLQGLHTEICREVDGKLMSQGDHYQLVLSIMCWKEEPDVGQRRVRERWVPLHLLSLPLALRSFQE